MLELVLWLLAGLYLVGMAIGPVVLVLHVRDAPD